MGESLFFDYECALPGEGEEFASCFDWCQRDLKKPLLAVGSSDGQLSFFHDEGERLGKEVVRRDKSTGNPIGPTCLAWGPAPMANILVTGWHDGALSVWEERDDKASMLREDKMVHKDSVCVVKWSPNASRIVSADLSGLVGVWKLASQGWLQTLCKISIAQSAVTHLVFRTHDQRPGAMGLEAPSFYFASEDGGVYFSGDDGIVSPLAAEQKEERLRDKSREVYRMAGPDGSVSGAVVLMYYAERDEVVGINDHLFMHRFCGPDQASAVKEISNAKLSLKPLDENDTMTAVWTAPGLLMTVSHEAIVRFWKLATSENYILRIEDETVPPDDRIISCAYSEERRILCAGTEKGYVLFWHDGNLNHADSSPEAWKPMLHATRKLDSGPVLDLRWAASQGLLAARTEQGCAILIEHRLRRKVRDGVALVQVSNKRLGLKRVERKRDDRGVPEVDLESEEERAFWDMEHQVALPQIQTSIPIKGCDANGSKVVVWSGRKAEVFDIDKEGKYTVHASFDSNATEMAIGSDKEGEKVYIYQAVESRIEVSNLSGTITSKVAISENEGHPVHLDVNRNSLAVATSRGVIWVYDISRAEPKAKPGRPGRRFEGDRNQPLGEIESIRINGNATRISVLARSARDAVTPLGKGVPAPLIQAPASSNADMKLYVYDLEADNFASVDCGKEHFPFNHMWDTTDPRLLAVEVQRISEAPSSENDLQTKVHLREVMTLFATAEKGALLQDRFGLPDQASLFGLSVPSLFLTVAGNSRLGDAAMSARTMRDFVGMDRISDDTRKALLEFSFNLTMGNMDEAYRAVKLIKGASVWDNMAHMCVKTGRLDVAEVCLSNMNDAKGARAVREARARAPEKQAHIAMVAVQLGMLDDAERLYIQAERYDLLNNMYQAAGEWEKAVEVAQKKDRINLRATYHAWARHLESVNDVDGAIACYEKADAHRVEVPRMLFARKRIKDLDQYIQRSGDAELLKWMAQYCESERNFKAALEYYKKADDHASMVRVKCFLGDYEGAEELVSESNSQPAAYYLAAQYEAVNRIADAIRLFAKAGKHNQAVRLARTNGIDRDLASLALLSTPKVMLETAQYLEEKRVYDSAVQLYQKAGQSGKALELCFSAKLFDALRTIADDLTSDTDPVLMGKVAEFFISNQHYDKAVHFYVTSGKLKEALDMVDKHKVSMTEVMAEKITDQLPEKDSSGNELRIATLRRIADICVTQSNYHLATKKYTQAGMKDKAMDALLKSGDTEKIIFFAGVLRSKEIYARAANYLQTLNWHTDGEIMKKIIEFYTKAKAYKQLALFYDACSQVEIDEYRDYDKALGALKESRKFMLKAEQDCTLLDRRIEMVDIFVRAKAMVKTDPQQFVKVCHELLDQPKLDAAVQVGDVFALLVEYHTADNDFDKAYKLIQQMRSRRIVLGLYLDQVMVDKIHKKMGIAVETDDDQVGEDIVED